MGAAAAAAGIAKLKETLAEKGSASIIVATGVSQFQVLAILAESDLPWNKITAFHLDEYVGLPITHEASFRKYLWERFVSKLPLPPAAFHFLDGEGEVEAECDRVSELITSTHIDVAFVGIGENGHLAFNDPPADFETEKPYLVVDLDEACRQQQLGEGWFPDIRFGAESASHLHVRSPNHEKRHHRLHRPRRAQGRGGEKRHPRPRHAGGACLDPSGTSRLPVVFGFGGGFPDVKPFDLQVNGYAGTDFCSSSLTGEQLHNACRALADDGVNGILATLITDGIESLASKLAEHRSASRAGRVGSPSHCRFSRRGTFSQSFPGLHRGSRAGTRLPCFRGRRPTAPRCRSRTCEALHPRPRAGRRSCRHQVPRRARRRGIRRTLRSHPRPTKDRHRQRVEHGHPLRQRLPRGASSAR